MMIKNVLYLNRILNKNFTSIIFARNNSTKDLIQFKFQSNDPLMKILKSSRNTEEILNVIELNHKTMNNQHLLQTLRSVLNLRKLGTLNKERSDMNQILDHPSFLKLCRILKLQSRTLETDEIIESMKILSLLGVPSNSTITQILLQVLRYQINILSTQQIIFLQFLLSKFDKNPLIDALQIALPLVLDINLKTKINRDDINELVNILQFAAKYQLSDQSVQLIIKSIMEYDKEINYQLAKSIVWSLCDLHIDSTYACLLEQCFKILTNNIDKLQIYEIDTILFKVTRRFSRTAAFYYNEEFLNACANYVVTNSLKIDSAVGVLRRLTQMDHVHIPLIDYVAKQIMKEHNNSPIKDRIVFIKSYLSSVVLANYKDNENINDICDLIENEYVKGCDNLKNEYGIKFTTELAIFNRYLRNLLENTFEKSYLRRIVLNGSFNQCQNLLLISQSLQYIDKKNLDLLPDPEIINSAKKQITFPKNDFPLKESLATALGGYNYFKSNINCQLGYNIDHILIMRKGEFPIAINSSTTNEDNLEGISLENIEQIAQDNQIIAIITFPWICYTMNTNSLKGTYIFMLKILESRGIKIIHISMQTWNKLLDFEKIPYLMQKIKEKSQSINESNILQ